MGLFDTDASSTPSTTDASGLPTGLLDPSLQRYMNQQTLLGMAQGLLNASGPSPVKQNPIGVAAAGAVGGAQAQQSSLGDALKLQGQLQQRQGVQATYQALLPKYGPEAARFYALNPNALAEQLKPVSVAPGGTLVAPMSISGAPSGGVPAPVANAAAVANGTSTPAGGNVIAQNNSGMMGDDAIAQQVQRRLLGDTSMESGSTFGMGAIGQINKSKYQNALAAAMKDQDVSPTELTRRTAQFPAYQKGVESLTNMEVNMGTARNEFQNIWPQFVAQVQKVNGCTVLNNFPTYNSFQNYLKEHAGDPDVVQLNNYKTALENQYVRAVSTSRSGPTVNDHNNFEDMISTNWNPAQIQSTGVALGNEMQAARNSLPQMKAELDQEFGLAPKAPAPQGNSAQPTQQRNAAPSQPMRKGNLIWMPNGQFYNLDGSPVQ